MVWLAYFGCGFGVLCLLLAFWAFAKMRKVENELSKNKLGTDSHVYAAANAVIENPGETEAVKKAISPLLDENKNSSLFDENEKLKGKIKKTEEKIDKLQEEIDVLDDKNDSLKKELNGVKSDKSKLEERLAEVNKEKEDLAKETNRKESVISFVQDVLSAKEIGEYGRLRQKVEELYRFIKFDEDGVVDCLKKCGMPDGIDFAALERWKSITSKPWLNGKKVVAFIGDFSAGKTSIVNAILSNGKVNSIRLPVSTKASTAIPTYIAGISSGEIASFSFVTLGDICKGISEESFRNVSKETLEDIRGVSSLIKYFVMGCDNQELAGLSILDTPGFSSNDSNDSERTIEVINECDALFWVIDINDGDLKESSKKTLNAICGKVSIPLYVILNKADSKSPDEVEATRKTVRQTFAAAGMTVADIFPFSTKDPQKYKVEDLLERIGKVDSRNIENTQFIDLLKDSLDMHLREMGRQVKDAQKENVDADIKCDELDSEMKQTIVELGDGMKDIGSIPQHKHAFMLWNDDYYEMTLQQHNEMKNIISRAKKNFSKLEKCYDERTTATAETKEAFEKLRDLEAKKRDLVVCQKKVDSLLKSLSALQEDQRALSDIEANNQQLNQNAQEKEHGSESLPEV